MRAIPVVLAATLLVGCRDGKVISEPVASRARGRPAPAPPATTPPRGTGLVFIAQTEAADCGPAALAIALSHHGHPTTLDAAKAAMRFAGEAITAFDLVTAAAARGLGVTGISADADTVLPVLKTGDILHVDHDHFVVFEALAADGVRVMDPANGPVLLDRATFARRYSAVVLLFERSPEALAARKRAIGLPPE